MRPIRTVDSLVSDGFDGADNGSGVCEHVNFRPAPALTPQAIAAIGEQVRVRVLRWFACSGLIDSDDVREMLSWENSGFSLGAQVRIAAQDRTGLERLLRYCARPPCALERLDLVGEQRHLPLTQSQA
jgi:hypothetical protein